MQESGKSVGLSGKCGMLMEIGSAAGGARYSPILELRLKMLRLGDDTGNAR